MSTSASITLLGRFPRHHPVRHHVLGRALSRTSSAVLPKASAWACANTLDDSMSWWLPSGLSDLAKPMRSTGTSFVPLMKQLMKLVLPVGARLAPEHRASLVINLVSAERDVLAVGLHRELLQVGGESLQVLVACCASRKAG